MPKKKVEKKKVKGRWVFVASVCGHNVNVEGNCSAPNCWNSFNKKYKAIGDK